MKKTIWCVIVLFLINVFSKDGIAQEISLQNFTAFNTLSNSWQLKGNVEVNPLKEGSFRTEDGTGLLVGSSTSGSAGNITTKKDHGNIALEFDLLLSHEASAVVWLQGRYGLRLADSWKDKKLTLSSNGAIIPPNTEGVGAMGYLPSHNVARAPGTWQHVKIVFDAPRFGPDETKTRGARLVSVEQNGVVIHENQYLSAPSSEALYTQEQTEGPLAFQIKKGHIAIKNVSVTKYIKEKVQLEDLNYQLYMEKFLDDEFIYWGGGEGDQIFLPDLSGLQPEESGVATQIHTGMVQGKDNDFALNFEGQLQVPISGEYQFEIVPNGVGIFELDGKELARWDALHDKGTTKVTADLEAGNYPFLQLYVNYGQPQAGLFVEGPGIKRQALHKGGEIPQGSSTEPIILTPGDRPLVQRSFLYFGNRKLLTCMNVGDRKSVV